MLRGIALMHVLVLSCTWPLAARQLAMQDAGWGNREMKRKIYWGIA